MGMRDHYEGTEFDMTHGVMAGPFGNPNRIEGGPGILEVQGEFTRAISIPRTVYGLMVEAKPEASKSIAWFATDVPASSVFVPLFAKSTDCAEPYKNGRYGVFSRDSAWWAFGFLANWMNINYKAMSEDYVYPKVHEEQQRILDVVGATERNWPGTEEATTLNEVQTQLQAHLVRSWWNFGEQLIATFNDGMHTTQEGVVRSTGYPAWWLQMIGFDNDAEWWRPQWAQWAALPPPLLLRSELLQSPVNTLASQPISPVLPRSFESGFVAGVVVCASMAALFAAKTRSRSTPHLTETLLK